MLIDEQMESLKGKLTPQEVAQYGRRKQQIDQLLMRIRLNGFKVEQIHQVFALPGFSFLL